MERLALYQEIVQSLWQEYAKHKPANGKIEVEVSFDTERNHYQIWHMGWMQKR